MVPTVAGGIVAGVAEWTSLSTLKCTSKTLSTDRADARSRQCQRCRVMNIGVRETKSADAVVQNDDKIEGPVFTAYKVYVYILEP